MRRDPLSETLGKTSVFTEEVDRSEAVDMRLLSTTGDNAAMSPVASAADCVASMAYFIRAKLDGRRSAVVLRRTARRFA